MMLETLSQALVGSGLIFIFLGGIITIIGVVIRYVFL